MLTDKELKKEFREKAGRNPEKYYAVDFLKSRGFSRQQCGCRNWFWSTEKRDRCGDPGCSGGFRFLDNSPARHKLDYIEVWQKFSSIFRKLGYTPIKRYPVVARWRDDAYFVQASIYDFQPYVVSGMIKPPANPLVVPQFCLRFNDIDNVGITGSHYTGFVMIGQHAFLPKNEFDVEKIFSDIHTWLNQGLGLDDDEIIFHEDAWAGGGNFGPCMEYFSRGLELGNQVYMMYEQTPSGFNELKIKVCDMGMGQERNAWFSQGRGMSYDVVFPNVMEKLRKITGLNVDENIIRRFLPYSSYLNIDEVSNVDTAWKRVASSMGINLEQLKSGILPSAALYSVAEHSRALLVALSDGALPSNVGGGYNLRVLVRRALSFMDRYKWDLSLSDICRWHAQYLKPLFPELMEHLDEIEKILEIEKQRYGNTKRKTGEIVSRIIDKDKGIDEKQMIRLYDSHGISPEMVREAAQSMGKNIEIPENFYAKVAELHQETVKEENQELKLDIDDLPATEVLYYTDYSKTEFTAKVLRIIGKYVILDRTYFYPTSGGQVYDTGRINSSKVIDVVRQAQHVVHVLESEPCFREKDTVDCEIDSVRRRQLAQNHTATHIVNASSRRILGNHINQAGAKKDVDMAHLDVTHYQAITGEELKRIESEANRIVSENIKLVLKFEPRDTAEQKYGMSIYQGGAVPGKEIRIVEIPGVDAEACAGTHLNTTSEVGKIKILKSTKIQDGIVRIYFVAGDMAGRVSGDEQKILEEAARLLGCPAEMVPARAAELFEKWKRVRKSVKKNMPLDREDFVLSSTQKEQGDLLSKTANILATQPEHVPNTLRRFINDIDEYKKLRGKG